VPGRLEVVGSRPSLVLDGAHNPAGARALADALLRSFTWERLLLVLAVSANKDVEGLVAPLAVLADVVYATRSHGSRSADAETVAEAARAAGAQRVQVLPSVAAAIHAARADATAGDLILVTGSLFTVAEAKGG
jgi:dihydrofolate synthase/folylpolyglutamate synthase